MFAVLSYLLSSEPSCLYSVQQAFDVSLHTRTGHMQIGYLPPCCEVARLVQVSAVLWDTASGICRSLLQMHGQISHGHVFLSRQPSAALVGRLRESHRTGKNTCASTSSRECILSVPLSDCLPVHRPAKVKAMPGAPNDRSFVGAKLC